MKFSTRLDVNVVAHEAADEIAVLLDLAAPALLTSVERAPASFQVVLDRSGSMSGRPLHAAIEALVGLVAKLDARDNFGVVVFDDSADVVVPAGPVVDREGIVAGLRSIRPGGTTDLGAGLLRGLQEVRRVVSTGPTGLAGATLLIVSDGHTNAGVTDPDRLAQVAAQGSANGVVVSTLGLGSGYDETLLAGIARAGSGNHEFAEDPDAAGAAIAKEVSGLLEKTIQAATLTVRFQPSVEMLRLYNDLPAHHLGDGTVMIELGDMYATEERKLLMRFHVPAMAGLGLAQVATLELRYVELPALLEQVVSLPITVNVVPGDQVAGRVADPVVHTEVIFQEAQDDKRKASEALEKGDRGTALRLLGDARTKLEAAGLEAPAEMLDDMRSELGEVGSMITGFDDHDSSFLSKTTRSSYHRQNRKRGRRNESESE